MTGPRLVPGSGRPGCACTAGRGPSRRLALGLFVGLVAEAAWAGNDLLEPEALGRHRAGLDMGAGATPRPRRSAYAPADGRGVASSTVNALDTLTRAGADLVAQLAKLDAELSGMGNRLSALRDDMDRQLAEFRLGLFCSGCMRTKSDIEGKGEKFPHTGQTIIKPTPQQIESKERELQRPIDNLERDQRDAAERRKRAMDQREQVLLQIDSGMSLWRSGLSFEQGALVIDEHQEEARYRAERSKAAEQLTRFKAQLMHLQPLLGTPQATPTTAQELADVRRELALWEGVVRDLDRNRATERRQTEQALAQAQRAAVRESETLGGYLNREGLRQILSAVATPALISPRSGFNDLGGKFRNGDYSPSRHDEVLGSVSGFVKRFQSMPGVQCLPSATMGCSAALPPTSANMATLPTAQPPAPARSGSLNSLIELR